MTKDEIANQVAADAILPKVTLECPKCGHVEVMIRERCADLFDRLGGPRCFGLGCRAKMGERLL